MSSAAGNATARSVVADKLDWVACLRLVCIEGYFAAAFFGDFQQDCSVRPWLFLLLMELIVAYCKQQSCLSSSEDLHIYATGSKQFKKLGELLNYMTCSDRDSFAHLLPDSCFHASAQNHILIQLLKCITGTNQVRFWTLCILIMSSLAVL